MNIGFQPEPNNQRTTDAINTGDWFPDVNLADFSDQFGIPAELNNATVLNALIINAGRVNLALADFKTKHLASGSNTLTDVPGETIGTELVLVVWYRQAVYSRAKAQLIRDQISIARKPNAESEAKEGTDLADFYDTQATIALANIHGQQSIGVALI